MSDGENFIQKLLDLILTHLKITIMKLEFVYHIEMRASFKEFVPKLVLFRIQRYRLLYVLFHQVDDKLFNRGLLKMYINTFEDGCDYIV